MYVAPYGAVCEACEQDRLNELRIGEFTKHYLHFPRPFTASHILQLGDAVSSLTGVFAEFGTAENRQEPAECVFVDRLDKAWVKAASFLDPSLVNEVLVRWRYACMEDEGESPQWASDDQTILVSQFLTLCRIAARTQTDLVMVWSL